MALPKRELPTYQKTMPASGDIIKYRPHTVKEEQILNMAIMSGETDDLLNAVVQIVENCTYSDVSGLFPAEVEYLYMLIKACSDTPIIPVKYAIDPDIDYETGEDKHKDCGGEISSNFNINEDVYININDEMYDYGTKTDDGCWLIKLEDEISIKIKINGTFTTTDDDTLYKLTECIIDEKEDTVSYKGVDYSKDEFNNWVNESPSALFRNFETFMNLSPETQAELKFKCKCGKEFKEVETGVLRFLV